MGKIVGIDLGTTASRVACFLEGKPVILENPEGDGTIPSYVGLRADGEPLIGEAARRQASLSPGTVVYAAKRLIGRAYADPLIRTLKQTLPYEIVPSPGGEAWIQVNGATYSPIEICALILKQLRDTASHILGEAVEQAVVAVPAYYNEHQRQAVRAACGEAGLRILRVISEPTAAALFHGIGQQKTKTLAIYDLGGGTFDISILEIDNGVFEVLATDGDTFLGGEDIDLRVQSYILDRLGLRADSLPKVTLQLIKEASEYAKIELSSRTSTQIILPQVPGLQPLSSPSRITLTRDILQEISQDLVDRTLAICERTLAVAERVGPGKRGPLAVQKIDEIILVGGSTRLPFVEDCVSRFFGRRPTQSLRREDAVALGCAVQAAVLNGEVKDVLLLDVLPFSIGVETAGGVFTPFLHKNITIPTKKSLTCSTAEDGQTAVSVRIFQGEGDKVAENRLLGEFDLEGLPDGPSGTPQVVVTLEVDANGQLTASARDLVSGASIEREFAAPSPVVHAVREESPAKAPAPRPAPVEQQSLPEPAAPSATGLRILVIATEWKSGNGGLSTLNRQLCTALAAAGQEVSCLVLAASPQEVEVAREARVTLIEAVSSPGQSEQVNLTRRPRLPPDWVPDYILGHGRVTGPAAAAIVEDHYPSAKRIHVIHMAPDEIEWFKLDRGDDAGARAETRTSIERDLGMTASRVVAIGPRLFNRFTTELYPYSCPSPLRLDPGFDANEVAPIAAPPGKPWRILLLGRAEDEVLKGLDIAAAAVGAVAKRRLSGQPALELVVRGARPDTSEELRAKLRRWSDCPSLKVVVIPFETATEQLEADYRRATLVLMPSRSEGFGLVGVEAITAGVPVLISGESGLGELLAERLTPEEVARFVVPITGDDVKDCEAWGRAVEYALQDRNASFQNAGRLRSQLGQTLKWSDSVRELLAAL